MFLISERKEIILCMKCPHFSRSRYHWLKCLSTKENYSSALSFCPQQKLSFGQLLVFCRIYSCLVTYFYIAATFYPDSCRNKAYAILLRTLLSPSLPHPQNLLNLLTNFNQLISQRKTSSHKLYEDNLPGSALKEGQAAVPTGTISASQEPTCMKEFIYKCLSIGSISGKTCSFFDLKSIEFEAQVFQEPGFIVLISTARGGIALQ